MKSAVGIGEKIKGEESKLSEKQRKK